MISFNRTVDFDQWLFGLKDLKARARIAIRIRQAELGNFGVCKVLNHSISEMKIDFGPGYRIYFAREARTVYLLLCGGDKSTQKADIKRAIAIWTEIRKELL